MSDERLRTTVRALVEQLARGEYDSVVKRCTCSRLTPDDLRKVVSEYGRNLVAPPENAYEELDAVQIMKAVIPTWSVRAPIWTKEEGQSDLALELTIALGPEGPRIELEDLHVL
jgi:hypothetical protein